MNLKKRLLLANFMTAAFPLVITVLLTLIFLFFYGKLFDPNLSIDRYQQLSNIEQQFFHHQQNLLEGRPETIEEEGNQQQLLDQLERIDGELVILKNDQLLFSSGDFTQIDVAKLSQAENPLGSNDQVMINNISYMVRSVQLNYPDGALAQVILMAPVPDTALSLNVVLSFMVLVFLISLIITNFFISQQLSQTILQPIQHLQQAAGEISKGNLEQEILAEGDQELQELCRDLEMMRIKLKELIHNQLRYEDNRKMLITSMSHDLKTPITSIKGYVEGILDGVANNPEKIKKYLNTIVLKADQVDQLIDDLLLFSKLDLNQIPFQLERVTISDYLKSVLAEHELELERKKIKLFYHNDLDQEQFIFLDREKMKRVVMNILDNAAKYVPEGYGEIHVRLRETNTGVIIEFRDNGAGIREKDLPFIFDRFYRGDQARTDRKGSGLGLAIGKQIVEGHQGRIWAVPATEGGTSIMISLCKG
ncbi:sensor histidine kinase [Dehalobacterium formicoaceticum]|uniref:histidine kinase n=1 Tax=Dehalobacterium formicoaceticum TaxID=51515 RepID=A0ABT1Y764_9FIRM|nr:ATP-binding protein [Dehalobacterium formicoaceticum]MCR6545531.1 ATP-binding protein [Dehalobacterium formicoaceticum]